MAHPDCWRIKLENQLLLQQLLEKAGFQVCIAKDGVETVKLFEEWHPHFIWMDRRMPRMDGLEATIKIHGLPGGKEVKIAALTASVFKEQKDELMGAGSDDLYASLPFERDLRLHGPTSGSEIYLWMMKGARMKLK